MIPSKVVIIYQYYHYIPIISLLYHHYYPIASIGVYIVVI